MDGNNESKLNNDATGAISLDGIRNSGWGEELCCFLKDLDNYKPTVPEAVTQYYVEKCGVTVLDPRILTLISLAADKFIAETIHEAKEQSLLKRKNRKRKSDLPVESIDITDLEGGLAQFNISWRRSRQSQSDH